jgi:signal transduction histidine kinase
MNDSVGWTFVYEWYLPTLSEIIGLSELSPVVTTGSPLQHRLKAERQWCAAIAALNTLLQQTVSSKQADTSEQVIASARGIRGLEQAALDSDFALSAQALVLSGPLPVLAQPELVANVSTWTFTKEPLGAMTWMPLQLLPAEGQSIATSTSSTLPLLPNDPLAAEPFCLLLTPTFSLVLALGELGHGKGDQSTFVFSFDPKVVWQAWRSLRSRLMLTSPQVLGQLNDLVDRFAPVVPDYQVVTQFSRLMLTFLPEPNDWEVGAISPLNSAWSDVSVDRSSDRSKASHSDKSHSDRSNSHHSHSELAELANVWHPVTTKVTSDAKRENALDKLTQAHTDADVELLQAIAHEVRTPLTTIRTLTRLLLKRQDLSPDVLKRLKLIDQTCTEQIDRFNLIFRAVELETAVVKPSISSLAATSLTQVFQQNVPRWQDQASQHNLTLEVILPQKLPLVVSDSTMLDQVLTGLIDRITHTLPPGSHIQLQVTLAGHQLKLQFESQLEDGMVKKTDCSKSVWTPTLKAIGQMLMFQPETGSLSLNLSVTKNLFQALGGKLIVKQRPQQGEVLTIFLPLETRKADD